MFPRARDWLPAEPPSERVLVVVVDGESLVRRAIAEALEGTGCRVLQSSNATDARRRLRHARERPTVAVCEHRDPGIRALFDEARQCSPNVRFVVTVTGDIGESELVSDPAVVILEQAFDLEEITRLCGGTNRARCVR